MVGHGRNHDRVVIDVVDETVRSGQDEFSRYPACGFSSQRALT
jgi:hypothetical protein